MLLAHGVGQVYELPIPLWAYLLGAAATVAASFVIRALAKGEAPRRAERRLLGPRVAGGAILVLRVIGLAGLLFALLSGLLVREDGMTFTSLLFWVAGIVGITLHHRGTCRTSHSGSADHQLICGGEESVRAYGADDGLYDHHSLVAGAAARCLMEGES